MAVEGNVTSGHCVAFAGGNQHDVGAGGVFVDPLDR